MLLGENGAGKTTLVRQMANLMRSTAGSIALFGRPVAQDSFHVPMNVGYMPQETASLNILTGSPSCPSTNRTFRFA